MMGSSSTSLLSRKGVQVISVESVQEDCLYICRGAEHPELLAPVPWSHKDIQQSCAGGEGRPDAPGATFEESCLREEILICDTKELHIAQGRGGGCS
jgi:hypothetical protein